MKIVFLDIDGVLLPFRPLTREVSLAWLAVHPEIKSWVAIDDLASWIGPEILDHTVITEGTYNGFREVDYDKAVALLGA